MTICKIIMPPMYSFSRLEKHSKHYIRRHPDSYIARSFFAGIYSDHMKNAEAAEEYQKLQGLFPLTNEDKLRFGEVMFRLKDYGAVISTLSQVINGYPRDKNANWYLGISHMKQLSFSEAIEYLEKVISAGSKRCEDFWNLGHCYDRLGLLPKAKDNYLKALSINPDSAELKLNLAEINAKEANNDHSKP